MNPKRLFEVLLTNFQVWVDFFFWFEEIPNSWEIIDDLRVLVIFYSFKLLLDCAHALRPFGLWFQLLETLDKFLEQEYYLHEC